MRNRKMVIGGLISVVVAGIIFWLVAGGGKKIETVIAVRVAITQTVNDTGYVQIEDKLPLQAFVSGRIRSLLIKQGDHVTVGQILLELENSDLDSGAEIGRLEWRIQ